MLTLAAILFAFGVFLSPNYKVLDALPVLRLEDAVLAVMLLWLVLEHSTRSAVHAGAGISRAFLLMALLAAASIGGTVFLWGQELAPRDFMILPMLLKYWLVFRFAQSLNTPSTRITFLYALLAAAGASALIGIMQYHDLMGVNAWLSPFYPGAADGLEAFEGVVIWARVGGTHGDPRRYGFLLVIGLAICASLALHVPRRGLLLSCLTVAGACLVALIYSLSRTAVLATIIAAMLALFLSNVHPSARTQTAVRVAVLVLVAAGVFAFFRTPDFQERVLDTTSESFQSSKAARQRDLMTPFRFALENPAAFLIGRGPSKASMRTDAHSDIGWFVNRFGLPGLWFYAFLVIGGIRKAYAMHRAAPVDTERAISMASVLALTSWGFYAMAEDMFKDGQVMALSMAFLGLLHPRWASAPLEHHETYRRDVTTKYTKHTKDMLVRA